jgi:hypothetical protein
MSGRILDPTVAVRGERIGLVSDSDWICLCGNRPDCDGFYPVAEIDGEAQWVEPVVNGPWDSVHYGCSSCGRVIDQDSLAVTGWMTEAARLAEQP